MRGTRERQKAWTPSSEGSRPTPGSVGRTAAVPAQARLAWKTWHFMSDRHSAGHVQSGPAGSVVQVSPSAAGGTQVPSALWQFAPALQSTREPSGLLPHIGPTVAGTHLPPVTPHSE